MRPIIFLKFILLAAFFTACYKDPSALSRKELIKYVSNENNGLASYKMVSEIKYSAKFLPSALLEEKENFGAGSKGMVFLVNLNPQSGNNALLYSGVANYEEFAARNEELFFNMPEYFYIRTDEGRINPIGCLVEHNYGVTLDLSFYVQFDMTVASLSEDFSLVFQDTFFSRGLIKFDFKKRSFEELID